MPAVDRVLGALRGGPDLPAALVGLEVRERGLRAVDGHLGVVDPGAEPERAPVGDDRDRDLTVELDSYTYHRSRYAWEQDRRREREAFARGDDFRRYTYGDVYERPRPMLTELRAVLA